MRIWFRCSKIFPKRKKAEISPVSKCPFLNGVYSCSKIYLGKKGTVCIPDQNMEAHFSYSVRDGVLVKIKRTQPHRTLFDYIDGAWFINDEKNPLYNQLIESLLGIAKVFNKSNYLEIYRELEDIICVFIDGMTRESAIQDEDDMREP